MDYKFGYVTVKLINDVTNYQYKNVIQIHTDGIFYHVVHETGTASYNINNILYIDARK